MRLTIEFIGTVVVISLIVSLLVVPMIKQGINMISPSYASIIEGLDSDNYSWNGTTLTLNGDVIVNGTVRSKQMIVANDNAFQSGIMMVPSVNGTEGPYIRFYGQDSQPKMYLMVGRSDGKANEWGQYP